MPAVPVMHFRTMFFSQHQETLVASKEDFYWPPHKYIQVAYNLPQTFHSVEVSACKSGCQACWVAGMQKCPPSAVFGGDWQQR